MTYDFFEIGRISTSSRQQLSMVEKLLTDAGLLPEQDLDVMLGVFDDGGNIYGCGALKGDTIKCLALSDALQGEGLAARLVTGLMNEAFSRGRLNVRVFTKPEYEQLFTSLGFHKCASTAEAVLLESDRTVLDSYKSYLSEHKCDGVIVANVSPVTKGHLFLIREAASHCRKLAIIPVAASENEPFPYEERVQMLKDATEEISNVEILEGSAYAVSPFTFPSYFIKERSRVSEIQAKLDLDIFCRHIAPSLGATKRFVGTEPLDLLTAQYNMVMKERLPAHGIEVVEIERFCSGENPVSASRVRSLLAAGNLEKALELVPESDTPFLLAHLAERALRMELDLEPKPGLVDPHDNGSHKDMDHSVMSNGIKALRPVFARIASEAFRRRDISPEEIRKIGAEGERMMLQATGGVNTHRGALFSMGLAVAAGARILAGYSSRQLGDEIAFLCRDFRRAGATHGSDVREKTGLPCALDYAKEGYPLLFRSWLPFLCKSGNTDETRLRLLMKIITELHDSNAIYRSGAQAAEWAKERVRPLIEDMSVQELLTVNEEFKLRNLSHGGAADMLSLTIFVASLTEKTLNLTIKI